jgi:GMP synthase (glutamine-hydrolysing)
MHTEKILIIDFGSQYTQLIARRVRELNVYCEIHPFNNLPKTLEDVKGVIFSGGPASVLAPDSPRIDMENFIGKFPVLGVCYGAQLIAHLNKGNVARSEIREYGRANINHNNTSVLFKNVPQNSQVWMSHGDTITQLADGFDISASTKEVKVAAYDWKEKNVYAIQFHPEVYHSTDGKTMLQNFLMDVCQCKADWTAASFVDDTVSELKNKLQNDKVVLGLSGGVDSSVAALLLHNAIGTNLYCIFVNNGLLRKNEYEEVLSSYKDLGLNVKGVDASELFLNELEGVSDPETKRKIIGRIFIEVFDKEASAIKEVKWLAQGTIYPDVIESVSVKGPSATIKSHHNVGGLPEKMNLKVVEPLNTLFKDEVRRVGRELNLPENILNRHPFPGPGLAIRILGEITKEKVKTLQDVDYIYINKMKEHGLYDKIWQAGTIFLPVNSVGVMGDERTYENAVALRAVVSTDGMTADWYHFPYEFLAEVSNEIINKVKGINRVVYDISSKPPATIEWE